MRMFDQSVTPESCPRYRRQGDGSPRFYSFWAINASLDAARLQSQLDRLKASGLDGVVFHPRYYPDTPPYLDGRYLELVSGAILHAKSIGLAFWIYDENGWPSGTVGGQLLARHPADAQSWAGLGTEVPERPLAEFKHGGQRWYLGEQPGPGVDYFSRAMTDHFIEMTYERYRSGLTPEAFDHVGAFFCDEPEFGLGHAYSLLPKAGAIPWTPRMPELFKQRYGRDLIPLIPLLFFPGTGSAEARIQFWELLTDVFCGNFVGPIKEWCRRHGKLFTAHVKGEEHPLFQVPTSGSCQQFFRHLTLPGIDALERYPANNFYPRQVSTAARQFGNGRCMVEAFGGSGWGSTPEDLERYLLWLGRNGLTDFVMHLSQYRLDSAALQDWPPSQPLHLTWSHLYAEVLDRVRRELQTRPREVADTLVIAPYRAIMANCQPADFLKTNIHNAATYPDGPAGDINTRFMKLVESLHLADTNFDVVDERTLEQYGEISQDQLRIGNCGYRRLIIDEAARLNKAAQALVKPLVVPTTPAVTTRITTVLPLVPQVIIPVRWRLVEHPVNSLFLESKVEADGWFSATFASGFLPFDTELEFVFADVIAEFSMNGLEWKLFPSDEGSRLRLNAASLRAMNHLRFRPARLVERPFVWLQGRFRVCAMSQFADGPGETVKTNGPFRIEVARSAIRSNLVADGFPFLRHALKMECEVKFPDAVSALVLVGGTADALRLNLDGSQQDWIWPINGEHRFAAPLAPGSHRLGIELIPNGYNFHGPHHYFGGDRFVVSLDQFHGRKNFADPTNAPAMTHVSAWHFRRFDLPTGIALGPASSFQLQSDAIVTGTGNGLPRLPIPNPTVKDVAKSSNTSRY
ncbi:MAG: hypothetical protein PHY43_11325 [Verrucomicrobiales bacterium]|nr:hypothetical protein [Verrucomicrobiales bacterium]